MTDIVPPNSVIEHPYLSARIADFLYLIDGIPHISQRIRVALTQQHDEETPFYLGEAALYLMREPGLGRESCNHFIDKILTPCGLYMGYKIEGLPEHRSQKPKQWLRKALSQAEQIRQNAGVKPGQLFSRPTADISVRENYLKAAGIFERIREEIAPGVREELVELIKGHKPPDAKI